MLKSAIIDTSVLICLNHLNLIKYLNLIYNKVYIPRAVEHEFFQNITEEEQTKRYVFLENFYIENSIWFKKCQAFRSELIELYRTDKKLDLGEAEVFAQNQELGNVNIMLLDEKKARTLAEKNDLAKNGVLYILAIFDLKLKNINYFQAVEKLKNENNTYFSKKIVNMVYSIVKDEIES
ncbi:putative nucleic acid-binding protein [Kordia periserrulae]|uniref:Putative nucleic acid-binding protein n=1 Tax=Kordia periserrulae TaxID=701523 RepID=A0A2T6BYF8_9FLAO|nr:hypothetical protein [Kordia periserrulae]PTX61066.1 putative nucleic acid-binding protein [Kordia periserrulae]